MQSWKNKKLSAVFGVAAVAWCGVLFFLSGQDALDSGRLSHFVAQIVMRIFPFLSKRPDQLEIVLRKCAHFVIFAIEGALLGAALMTRLGGVLRPGSVALLGCMVLAVLNEFHQSFVEGRSCEFRDMMIDSGGGLTGILFAALLLWLAHRLRRRRANVIIS